MQEVKHPKKPLIYFYVAMILAILVFNCLVAPYLARKAIEDVDYGTFMTMTENGESIAQIVFGDLYVSKKFKYGKYDFAYDQIIDDKPFHRARH